MMFYSPMQYNKYKVTAIQKLSKTISEVILNPDSNPIRFLPGQYVNVYLDDNTIKDVDYCSYSIASSPENEELHLIVSNGKNNVKIDFFNQHLNSIINISDAHGNAYYREESKNNNIIAVANGTGIAPIKAIIDYNKNIQSQKNFFVYYIVKSKEDLVFNEYFNALKKQLNLSCIIFTINSNHKILYDLLLNSKSLLANSDFYVFGSHEFVLDIQHKVGYYCSKSYSRFFSDMEEIFNINKL